MTERALTGIGVMSGTSADGIDAAAVRVTGSRGRLAAELLWAHSVEFSKELRRRVLAASAPGSSSVDLICSLGYELGHLFAEVVAELLSGSRMADGEIEFVALHGQTVYHLGDPRLAPPGLMRSTLQLGAPAIVARKSGLTVVSDFRAADIAEGGQGAPLTSFADLHLFEVADSGSLIVNVGGIANLTAVPPAASGLEPIAFDTGPGNMLMDAVAVRATRGEMSYDRDGELAGSGRAQPALLERLMGAPYFRLSPPRTAGREQFGGQFLEDVLAWPEASGCDFADLAATFAEFTARSIAGSAHRFVAPEFKIERVVVGGGGARNPYLMERLAGAFEGVPVLSHEDFGIPSRYKEAMAFAMLGAATLAGIPSNVPSCTGARRAVVLGSITPGEGFAALVEKGRMLSEAWRN